MSSPTHKNISPQCSLCVLLICMISLFTVTIMNVLMGEGLFIRGVNWVYDYQQSQPQKWIIVIYNLFANYASTVGVGIVIAIYFAISKRKLKVLVHTTFLMYCVYLMALLKQSFQQTRPIWYDSRTELWQWLCPDSFGNPSGHIMTAILLHEPIISDTIGYKKFRLMALPYLVLIILVTASRIYLGVHSANDVFYGLVLGFINLVLYKYIYQKALYSYLWSLFVGKKHLRKVKIIALIVMNIITLGMPIVFYYVNRNQNPVKEKDLYMIQQLCDDAQSGQYVQGVMLRSCAIGCVVFGFTFGLLALPATENFKRYYMGLWRYPSKKKILMKLVVYGICIVIPFAPFGATSQFAAKASLLRFFLLAIGIELAFFSFVYFVPILANKLKLMQFSQGSSDVVIVQTEKQLKTDPQKIVQSDTK